MYVSKDNVYDLPKELFIRQLFTAFSSVYHYTLRTPHISAMTCTSINNVSFTLIPGLTLNYRHTHHHNFTTSLTRLPTVPNLPHKTPKAQQRPHHSHHQASSARSTSSSKATLRIVEEDVISCRQWKMLSLVRLQTAKRRTMPWMNSQNGSGYVSAAVQALIRVHKRVVGGRIRRGSLELRADFVDYLRVGWCGW